MTQHANGEYSSSDSERKYCNLIEDLLERSKDGQGSFVIDARDIGTEPEHILHYLLSSTVIHINRIEKKMLGEFYLPEIESIEIEFNHDQLNEEYECIFPKKSEQQIIIEAIVDNSGPYYEIQYEDYQRIMLHKCIGDDPDVVISSPNFRSENQKFFEYVYKHPNRAIDADVIKQEALKSTLKNAGAVVPCKEFKAIIANLRFENDLKKMFFPYVSKEGVYFRNPVYLRDLESAGLSKIDISYL
jgi:hypothetical protein